MGGVKKYIITTVSFGFLLSLWAIFVSPVFGYEGLIPCNGPECQACHFLQLGQNLLSWFIKTMAAVIVLIFAWGGLKMVMSGGNTEGVSEAKGMMTNSVIGFIILLGAWLIVDTVLKELTNGAIGPWNEIQCVTLPERTTAPTGGTTSGGVTAPSVLSPGALSDAEARALLEGAGIRVNKTQAEGTSLQGIKRATVENVVNLKNNCGCDVIFTGGTESGHAAGEASHGSGNKYDVGLNAQLNNFIQTTYTPIGTRSDGAEQYRDTTTGVIYARESNHWDVLVP